MRIRQEGLAIIDSELLSFSAVALALAVTPGADIALVTNNAVVWGHRDATVTISGICMACAIHAIEMVTGGMLILLGLRLAVERR